MSAAPLNHRRIGILGGGQLSLMLVQSAKQLGLEPLVLVASKEDPVCFITKNFEVVDTKDQLSLQSALQQIDLLIFENEFLTDAFVAVAKQTSGLTLIPSIEAINRCSDKLQQKKYLDELAVPHPIYRSLSMAESTTSWLDKLMAQFTHGFVLKWSRFGYDGYGVFLCAAKDFAVKHGAALAFIEKAKERGIEVFAEQMIAFKRELALVSTRALSGDFTHYPVVVTIQVDGRCAEVKGPARHFGLSDAIEQKMQADARAIAEKMDLYGTFAIEFFEDTNGAVFVNEIAPRVHNSGHVSMDATTCSQFSNHMRAVAGMELGSVESAPYFAMINILGPKSYAGPVASPQLDAADLKLHWYHKHQSTPGRKLGHINLRADTLDQLQTLTKLGKQELAKWHAAYAKGDAK